ncbi:MAG: leucyl aminopeptidase family protein, partial [Candidatus Puniceispirillum sp.]|nr:leucyl aminopeptidase family protein [Candidatus Puniceispirillum sp.]
MADTYHNATDFGLIELASAPNNVLPLHLLTTEAWQAWYKAAANNHQRWIDAQGFEPKPGRAITLPGHNGTLDGAVAIISTKPIWDAAMIANGLPVQTWQIDNDSADTACDDSFVLGWALAHYRYVTYRDKPASARASLMLPAKTDISRILGLASGIYLGRDMINMPPNKMNPAGLEDTARRLATTYKAKIDVISGA